MPAEKDRLRPGSGGVLKCPETGSSESEIWRRFLARHGKRRKMFRAGLYARVSTNDNNSPRAEPAMPGVRRRRGWDGLRCKFANVNSGAARRKAREKLLEAARRPRNRSGAGVAPGPLGPVSDGTCWGLFRNWSIWASALISLTEALDLTTPCGPRQGWSAGHLRRVRKEDSAGENQAGSGSGAGGRETTGPPGYRGGTRRGKSGTLHRAGISNSEFARPA